MYVIDGNRLVFTWPNEETLTDHVVEIFQGVREAGQRSLAIGDTIRIVLPNYETHGMVEARATNNRVFPALRTDALRIGLISSFPYTLLRTFDGEYSPYYAFEIPGLCQLIDSNMLAISPEFIRYVPFITNQVFNCLVNQQEPMPITSGLIPYTNLARTIAVLNRRPRAPKNIDFLPVFTALFGEKIATVIMKEIK